MAYVEGCTATNVVWYKSLLSGYFTMCREKLFLAALSALMFVSMYYK
jgi:hypothetical protein